MFEQLTKRMTAAAVAGLLVVALQVGAASAANGRGDYDFEGTIESLPSGGLIGDWVVSGTVVHVTSSTELRADDGPFEVGALVEVRGELESDGSVDAERIRTEDDNSGPGGGDDGGGNGGGDDGPFDDEIHGTIESLPSGGLIGDWVVSGRVVHVFESTSIEQEHGQAVVGARVEVHGAPQSDGSLNATRIEVNPSNGGGGNGGGGNGGGGNGGGGDDGPFDDEIHGTIESLPSGGLIGDWVVSGRVVHVFESTSIEQEHGQAVVGAAVEVHGVPQSDGSLNAVRIEVNPSNGGGATGGEAKFFGTVESLPSGGLVGIWTVSGRAVRVAESTVVEREHNVTPGVGSYVEVEGAQLQDGSLQARKVEVKTGGSPSNPGGGSSARSGYVSFRAAVESLPGGGLAGEWVVGGRTVFVTSSTRIKQKKNRVEVGRLVEVRGNQREDGSIDASRVDAKASGGGRRSTSSFYGTVESMPASGVAGEWVVAGRTVTVTSSTFVDQERGRAAVGAYVEVKGSAQQNGAFVATKIEVKDGSGSVGSSGYIEFYGTVEALPASGLAGEWIVSGRRVFVTASTQIREKHGPVRLGVRVEIEGNQRSDGTVDAAKVGTED